MSIAPPLRAGQPRESVLLEGIRWSTYEKLLSELGEHSHLRLTYDQGRLHIMSPLPIHERLAQLLGQFVRILAAHARLPYICLGTVTMRRKDVKRGLEPDNCFYLANAQAILGKRELDFRVDPPPDLAIEVDITHKSLDRMGIYAALKVPEIWRCEEDALRCYHRNKTGRYEEKPTSLAFPWLRVADLEQFLTNIFAEMEGDTTGRFQDWLRTHRNKRKPGKR